MDQPDFNSGKSPRRELQGPRPTPLKVRKDSHKIRKPPVAPQQQPSQPPQPHHHHHHHHHQTHPPPPVIIYTVSPKVIHTDPSEFMTLVQRLTGSSSTTTCSTSSITSSSSYFSDHANGAISPAARFASTEKTKSPEKKKQQQQEESSDMGMIEGVEISTEVERTGFFPGILSPGPAALPPIPANFFSPPSDPNPMSFLYDFSPVLQGNNKNYLEGSSSFMMPSPSFFLSPQITSPTTPSLDIFNNFFDFQF